MQCLTKQRYTQHSIRSQFYKLAHAHQETHCSCSQIELQGNRTILHIESCLIMMVFEVSHAFSK